MKILITGAGGMLGTDLVARLSSTDELVGVGRKAAPRMPIPFKAVDLTKPGVAEEMVQSVRPEIILHAAAMTDVDGCETNRVEALRGNFQVTRSVADAANRVGALIIFFSTDFVFDGKKEGPYVETDVPHPLSVYGESKLLAERYLMLRSKRFLILRTSWLFGSAGNNFPRKILKQAASGKPFSVISDQFGNPTFTGDLSDAVVKILRILSEKPEQGLNEIYHVANEGVVSRFEFSRTILKKKGVRAELVTPISSEAAPPRPAARPRNSALSTAKLKERYGITLRHWEEGLETFLEEDQKIIV